MSVVVEALLSGLHMLVGRGSPLGGGWEGFKARGPCLGASWYVEQNTGWLLGQ